jgi:hypothetical protein
MMATRYSPPGSARTDVPLPRKAPPNVRHACQILVVSLLLSLHSMFPLPTIPPDVGRLEFAVIVGLFVVSYVALGIWLIIKIHQGRNWARWTMLVLLAIFWLVRSLSEQSASEFAEQFARAPIAGTAGLLEHTMEAVACYLLLLGDRASAFFSEPGA